MYHVAVTVSPSSACGNLTMEKCWATTFTPSCCFILCFSIKYCTDFYLFVLCFSLIIPFLFQLSLCFTPQLSSSVSLFCTWYFYNSVSLGYDFYPSPVVLFWIYVFTNHLFHFVSFLFSNFACLDILLFLTTAPVGISSIMEHPSSKLCWLYTPPPSQLLGSTLLAGTTLLRSYFHPCSSLYKLHIGTAGFLFEFMTLEDGTIMLSWSVNKRLPLLAA